MFSLHAHIVGLIHNLKTVRIGPQFNVVYDSNFETVNGNNETPPEIWTELIALNSFRSDYENEDYIPELDQEWFSEEELQQQKLVD